MPEPAANGETPRRNILTSFVLISVTLLVALACVVVLACTLTQTRVATLIIEGVPVSITKLDYAGRRWVDIEQDKEQLRAAESDKNVILEIVTGTALDKKAQAGNLEVLLAAFYHRIATSEPELAQQIHNRGHQDQVGRILGSRAELTARHSDLEDDIKKIEFTYQAFRRADEEDDSAQTKMKVKEQQVALLTARVDRAYDEVFNVIKPKLDPDARARVENAFYELNIHNYNCGVGNTGCGLIGGYLNRAFYRMLTLRSDLLTLLLVVLMGVLGSALQITHAYFMKNQRRTIGGYFQRLSVGAMTALVIFIVAKAGVPVIADPSRLGGETPINPYFVSFLAVVSGLLSENAIANIQAQGARLFGPGGAGPDRWARTDLSPDLEAQGLSVAKLAEHLEVSEEVAKAMLAGQKEMNTAQQKIVAIYLRRDPRDIFTDIPPTRT
jgi:hypothetical protein